MCGIAGIVALTPEARAPERGSIERMIAALQHRGPDEAGLYRDHRCALGHARLAIIDVASGQQPMSDDAGRIWLVFNGEIFNYIELRTELIAAGRHFRTNSDTEVIIQAWDAWGEDAFRRFNGQFALALWESDRQRLVLARDRLGVRPLHMAQHGGQLWFASEVKALFAGDRSMPRAFDPIGLAQTFTFWSPIAPRTPFLEVSEIEPGHVCTVEDGKITDRAYWAPSFDVEDADVPGASRPPADHLRDLLEDAVRLRIERSDVPVGSYLSGGLDSSLIAALGHRIKQDRFKTFSIRFEDSEFDEAPYQRAMVDRIGSDHHEVVVRRRDIAESFPAVVAHAERPILRAAPAPMYLLSEIVRAEGIKVVLTGEGADEVFAGYDLFREAAVRRFWGRDPDSTMRPRLLERLYPYMSRSPVAQQAFAREFFRRGLEDPGAPGFGHLPRWASTSAIQRLFRPELRAALTGVDVVGDLRSTLPAGFRSWSPLAQDQYLEMRTLLAGYLLSSQGDRMLMAHSVEGRFPFLDTRVVEFANGLPARQKLRGLEEKHILRHAAEGLLPEAIIRRSKQPFRAPDAASFVASDAPDWVAEVLRPDAVRAAGVFDVDGVARLWRKCSGMTDGDQVSNADNMALVGILSTGLIYEGLIRRPAPDPAIPVLQTIVDRGTTPPVTAGV